MPGEEKYMTSCFVDSHQQAARLKRADRASEPERHIKPEAQQRHTHPPNTTTSLVPIVTLAPRPSVHTLLRTFDFLAQERVADLGRSLPSLSVPISDPAISPRSSLFVAGDDALLNNTNGSRA